MADMISANSSRSCARGFTTVRDLETPLNLLYNILGLDPLGRD